MKPNPFTDETRKAAAETRERKKLEREAETLDLGHGWTCYPDTPPGVGVVLLAPNGRKTYHRDQETAKLAFARYRNEVKFLEREKP
jgi:hypothetical protein